MKHNRMVGVGTSSILAIFATLALTALSLLSVYTAAAGQILSEKACAAVTGYYAAEMEANRILADLRRGEYVEGVQNADGMYTYAVAIDEKTRLQVCVAMEGTEYRILLWQTQSRLTWEADESIHVFDMQN